MKGLTSSGKYIFVIGVIIFVVGVGMFLNDDLPSALFRRIGGIMLLLSLFFREKKRK